MTFVHIIADFARPGEGPCGLTRSKGEFDEHKNSYESEEYKRKLAIYREEKQKTLCWAKSITIRADTGIRICQNEALAPWRALGRLTPVQPNWVEY